MTPIMGFFLRCLAGLLLVLLLLSLSDYVLASELHGSCATAQRWVPPAKTAACTSPADGARAARHAPAAQRTPTAAPWRP